MKTLKMTRDKVAELYGVLNQLGNTKGPVKFGFIAAKNKRVAEPEVKSLQEANKPIPEYMESEDKRLKLCREYAEKDDKGNPVVMGQAFKIQEDLKAEFDEKIEALKEEYKETIEETEKRQEEFRKLLEEEIELEFNTFKMSEMPEEMLNRDMDVLYELIEDDTQKKK